MIIIKKQKNGDKVSFHIKENDCGDLRIRDVNVIAKGKRKPIYLWDSYSNVPKEFKINAIKKQLNIESNEELDSIFSELKTEFINITTKRLELSEIKF